MKEKKRQKIINYFIAFFAVFLCTLLGKILGNFLNATDQIMIYLIGCVIVAVRCGRLPSVLFSFLSVMALNFFFVEPIYTFSIADKSYWLTLAVMLLTSLVIATQAIKLHEAELQKTRTILLSSISHDLRTPLSSIVGASETVITNFDKLPKDAIINLVNSIKNQSQRLSKIVTNLLDITALEAGNIKLNKQPYYIQEIIGCAVLHLKDNLKNHQIEISCDKDLPMVKIDGVLIEQVIVNLLENAAKYTCAESKINIEAKLKGKKLLIKICDNGGGIFSKNKSKEGYGLGLIICKNIVKAHGSKLKIWNDNGANFSFTLSELIFTKKYEQ